MAQMLLTVVGQYNPDDPYMDARLPKPGDILAIQTDDAEWGQFELTHPEWRIIVLPSHTAESLQYLLEDEKPTSPGQKMVQYRAFYLNLSAPQLPANLKAYLADNTRAQPKFVVTSGEQAIINVLQQKSQRPDPNVIG